MRRASLHPLLLRNADCYAPRHMGVCDVLILNEKIMAIQQHLDAKTLEKALPELQIIDVDGALTIPGLIDHHNHFGGADGEGGFQFRTPPAQLSSFTKAGITSAVGLLGTDGFNRSLEELLAKARALEAEGLSTWMYSGSYQLPGPHLTGSAGRDICLIDKVIGCKVALSDHRSSHPSPETLRALVSQVRTSAMLAGKRGVVCVHMGSEVTGLQPLRDALKDTDIPPSQFLPTHVGRCDALMDDTISWLHEGGIADVTAGGDAADRVEQLAAARCNLSQVTISSDGNGSMSCFNERKELVAMGVGNPQTLLHTLRSASLRGFAPLEQIFALATENVARHLGLPQKGQLTPGFDADVLVLSPNFTVSHLIARGQLMVQEGKILIKGMYE